MFEIEQIDELFGIITAQGQRIGLGHAAFFLVVVDQLLLFAECLQHLIHTQLDTLCFQFSAQQTAKPECQNTSGG